MTFSVEFSIILVTMILLVSAYHCCADYVQRFKAEHGHVRMAFIEELNHSRHLGGTGSTPNSSLQLADLLLSAEDSKKVAGCSEPQISDVVDLWIGRKLKGSDLLFRMATVLARVQGFGRYITCIVQKTGVFCYCIW